MEITFLGACGTVTGSKYQIVAGARTKKGSVPFFGLIALVTEAEPVKRTLTHTPNMPSGMPSAGTGTRDR